MRKTKVKKSDILRIAKQHIEDKTSHAICAAIRMSDVGTDSQINSLTTWVRKLLGGYSYYTGWLRDNHPAFYKRKVGNNIAKDFELCRPGRIAWLDWMITECEKKGE